MLKMLSGIWMGKECAAKKSTFNMQRGRDTKQETVAKVADATSDDPSLETAEETIPAQTEAATTEERDATDPEVREDEDQEATTDDAATIHDRELRLDDIRRHEDLTLSMYSMYQHDADGKI
jgi:hypothetical protein